jgi:hypothetical protein
MMREHDWVEEQGWSVSPVDIRCGQGHDERVFVNKDFPGVLLHEDCCGTLRSRIGTIEEVRVLKARFYT